MHPSFVITNSRHTGERIVVAILDQEKLKGPWEPSDSSGFQRGTKDVRTSGQDEQHVGLVPRFPEW